MAELTGKVALVTGGGSGLGAATCRMLAAAGATVLVADLRAARAEEVATTIERAGGRAHPHQLDVGDAEQAERAVGAAVAGHGGLDILINCAGIDVTRPVEELSAGDWDAVLTTNLRGPFLLSRAAFPALRRRGGGHIVNIVSTAAKRAWANATAYHASKWGLLGLTYALHVEGRPAGIKVTAIINGGMRTPFLLDRFPDIDPTTLQDPKNVANTILFVLNQPDETVIPEILVLPMRETSWP